MKRLIFLSLSFFMFNHSQAQYVVDFESNNVGTEHTATVWENYGFDGVSWTTTNRFETTITTAATSNTGTKSLLVTYPEGGFGPGSTGHQAPLEITPSQEYYLSYWMKFSSDFSWGTTSQGGKLPGLGSDGLCSGGSTCDGTNGFTTRYMWRTGGKAVVYLYHMDKPGTYGEDVELKDTQGSNVVFPKGEWVNLIQRVKINTGNNNDGELQVWYNGEEVLNRAGLRFVNDGSLVDRFYFSTFHGGGDAGWAPENDCEAWFDDIVVSTNPDDVFGPLCLGPDLGEDILLCPMDEVILESNLGPTYTFSWYKDGEPLNESGGSLHVTESGIYGLSVSSNDCVARQDEVVVTVFDELLDVAGVTICEQGDVTLSVNGSSDYYWYETLDNVQSFDEGTSIVVNVEDDKVFFVESNSVTEFDPIGAITQTGTTWNTSTFDADDKRIKFVVEQGLTIEAVDVYVSNASTDINFRILESDLSTVHDEVEILNVGPGKTTLQIGYSLEPGTYYIDLVNTSANMAYEAANGIFPITIEGVVQIENVETWQEEWNGFFYNWVISSGSKSTCRTPVAVVVDEQDPDCVTGLDNGSQQPEITLYPNPSTGRLRISGGFNHVEVCDVKGNVLMSTSASEFLVDQLYAGTYWCKIYTDSGVEMLKLIKD